MDARNLLNAQSADHEAVSKSDSAARAAGTDPQREGHEDVDYAARPQGKPATTRELFERCWKIILVTLVLSLHADVDMQLFPPYFYSRVACCGQGPDGTGLMLPPVERYGDHNITLYITHESCDCDLDATYGKAAIDLVNNNTIAACKVPPLDHDSALWSHSKHCTNFPYVQSQQQTVSTVWGGLQLLFTLPTMVVFSKVSDVYGRRQVFYWTTVMTIFCFAIFAVDAAFNIASDFFIYITAPLLATFSIHDAVSWSMAVDLVPDPVDQAAFFPLITPIFNKGVSSLIGDIVAYFVLKAHLDNYTVVWSVLFAVAVGGCVSQAANIFGSRSAIMLRGCVWIVLDYDSPGSDWRSCPGWWHRYSSVSFWRKQCLIQDRIQVTPSSFGTFFPAWRQKRAQQRCRPSMRPPPPIPAVVEAAAVAVKVTASHSCATVQIRKSTEANETRKSDSVS